MNWDADVKPETTVNPANGAPDRVVEVNVVEVTSEPMDAAAPAAIDANTETANTESSNTESSNTENAKTEEFRIQGDELVTKVKALIHAGNIRRIIVKNETGHTLIEIPLTVGVVGGVLGAALFPVLAAVGAIGAVVAHLTLVIEKRE